MARSNIVSKADSAIVAMACEAAKAFGRRVSWLPLARSLGYEPRTLQSHAYWVLGFRSEQWSVPVYRTRGRHVTRAERV